VPDVVIEDTELGFDVRIERSGLPSVTVEPSIVEIAHDRSLPPDVRRYLRGKLEEARWLAEAVENRKATLLRVAAAACKAQRAFLANGPGHMVPLSMTSVAAELDLALSTVSRAVAGKHVQTRFGILPLKSLFQAQGGGVETAAIDDVREILRSIFAAEDSANPLSDDHVVAELQTRGLHLARRTVAKHRAELGIKSSYQRKKHA
jgi:RNA polymerase sigma-54 factor